MGATGIGAAWLQRPLCRGYRAVVFVMAHVAVRTADAHRDQPFGWALGLLPNTEAEVLGLWSQPDASADLLRDLRELGVERITFVMDAGWQAAADAALNACPRARRAPSTEHFVRSATEPLKRRLGAAASADLRAAFSGGSEAALSRVIQSAIPATDQADRMSEAQHLQQSLAALSEQDRRFVLAADRTATVLLEELARAVRRNGYFLNQDAAIEFVAEALLGAERRMDRERAAMAAHVGTLRAAPQGRLAESRAV
ncbi:transposase [Roseateles sp. LYH14W]|uniref:Transposase n=1 Tax=Pelomonas parva TaxID=3299032 RepID=A0ABW7F8L6_9BURK